MNYEKLQFEREIIEVVRSLTSDKWSDKNNERFYHVKQTVENGWRCDITIRSL